MLKGKKIVFNSANVDDYDFPSGTEFRGHMVYNFNQPLQNYKRKLRLAFVKFVGYFSTNNISAELENNVMRYSSDSGATWSDLTIPEGNYDIKALSQELSQGTSGGVSLVSNFATSRTYLQLASGYQVDFVNSSPYLKRWLGFDSVVVTASRYGENVGNVNPSTKLGENITSWQIRCDVIDGYIGRDVLASFTPRGLTWGAIEYNETHLLPMQVTSDSIASLEVRVTDNHDELLKFNGEDVVLELYLIEQ